MEKTILAIIPARGGSKRIPKKNIKILAGKPLIQYTIDAACKAEIDDVVVSTDNREISSIVEKFGVEVLKRPKILASDWAKTIDVILDVLRYRTADIVICLQPTSPLRTIEDINDAIKLFLKEKCESVISCCEVGHNQAWLMRMQGKYLSPVWGNKYFEKRSQDLPKVFVPNGAIYISTPKILQKYRSFYTNKIIPYIMPPERSLDVDDKDDFLIAEELLNKK